MTTEEVNHYKYRAMINSNRAHVLAYLVRALESLSEAQESYAETEDPEYRERITFWFREVERMCSWNRISLSEFGPTPEDAS